MAVNTRIQAVTDAPPISRLLAEFVVSHPSAGWPADVDEQAKRTFMNWLGCAIGAAHHESVEAALEAARFLGGEGRATVLGRSDKVGYADAALINGIASHTFDFDDTHLKTIIHPAGPVCSALFALIEHPEFAHTTGREFIDALVLGIDVSCRVGNMLYPDHYDRGWHITGTTGGLGAAAACSRIMKLSVDQTLMALGIAASQPVGLREQFGTMTKPLHPGAAAQVGLTAASLARYGFTSSARSLEAPRGFAQVISTKFDWNEVTDELGKRFEISFNAYKPFACGIVIHPSIDACVQLREQGVTPENLERIDLRVHSLVLELTGRKEPADGLQGKFSVYHGCAAGLVHGQATELEYDDDVVNDPVMVAVRRKVQAIVDDTINEDAVVATAHLKDGRQITVDVQHAIGSLQKPMLEPDLERKFHSMADAVLPAARVDEIIVECWKLKDLPDLRGLAVLASGADGHA